jgi:hypothetical protein
MPNGFRPLARPSKGNSIPQSRNIDKPISTLGHSIIRSIENVRNASITGPIVAIPTTGPPIVLVWHHKLMPDVTAHDHRALRPYLLNHRCVHFRTGDGDHENLSAAPVRRFVVAPYKIRHKLCSVVPISSKDDDSVELLAFTFVNCHHLDSVWIV